MSVCVQLCVSVCVCDVCVSVCVCHSFLFWCSILLLFLFVLFSFAFRIHYLPHAMFLNYKAVLIFFCIIGRTITHWLLLIYLENNPGTYKITKRRCLHILIQIRLATKFSKHNGSVIIPIPCYIFWHFLHQLISCKISYFLS